MEIICSEQSSDYNKKEMVSFLTPGVFGDLPSKAGDTEKEIPASHSVVSKATQLRGRGRVVVSQVVGMWPGCSWALTTHSRAARVHGSVVCVTVGGGSSCAPNKTIRFERIC